LAMGGQSGEVVGGPGALTRLEAALTAGELGSGGLVVMDAAVADTVTTWWAERIPKVPAAFLTLSGGEGTKTWTVISSVYDAALAAGVGRDGWFLAVGGGALSDAVGFAAATYLRGVTWAAAPTTLLAQVDAAIGGKTAINLPAGKNLVGAFHLPRLVAVAPDWLGSLPEREWQAGFGELAKTALLMGAETWDRLEAAPLPWREGAPSATWSEWVERAARFKCRVVARDPTEHGERVWLNLGHTTAHALEQVGGYQTLNHGEAVGLGLGAALRLSEKLYGLSPHWRRRLRGLLERWEMPVVMPPGPLEPVLEAMRRDKKKRAGTVRWVLLEEIGRPHVTAVPDSAIADVLAALQEEGV
jgi:3-dehydroquinate synthase